ncbi:MAG: cell envelope integrity protein TolA [Wigglesworthia glossinidia]|nr:cell envelope integrity protein TolA [Wigglesworthia glossinidia]
MKVFNYNHKNAKLAIYLSILLHLTFFLCLYLTISLTKKNNKNFYQSNILRKRTTDIKQEKNILQEKLELQDAVINFYYQEKKINISNKNSKETKKITKNIKTDNIKNIQYEQQKKNITHKSSTEILSKKSKEMIFNTVENLNKKIYYNNNLTSSEIENYKESVKQSIKNKLYDYNTFIGKVCELNLEIYSSGSIKSIRIIRGDESLCRAAITSARLARIPPTPNLEVYQVAKKITLRFEPE